MLELHRVDLAIVESAAYYRGGATVQQIRERMIHPVSIDSIKRHLPGLVRLGAIRGAKAFRDEQLVTVWIATAPASEQQEICENSQGA